MNKWLLGVGAVMALATALFMNEYISDVQSSQTSAKFLQLKEDTQLAKGMVLSDAMLKTVSLPESFRDLSSFAIPDSADNRQWIVGRAASRDIPAGSLLQYDFFSDDPVERFAAKIGEGMRAMSVPVDPITSVTYFVEPGSRIDLVGTLEVPAEAAEVPEAVQRQTGLPAELAMPGLNKLVTKTILQNVKVLAVGSATTRGGYLSVERPQYSTITIEVSPQQAEKLVFAMNELQDNLTIMLRNPANDEVEELPTVSWEDLQ